MSRCFRRTCQQANQRPSRQMGRFRAAETSRTVPEDLGGRLANTANAFNVVGARPCPDLAEKQRVQAAQSSSAKALGLMVRWTSSVRAKAVLDGDDRTRYWPLSPTSTIRQHLDVWRNFSVRVVVLGCDARSGRKCGEVASEMRLACRGGADGVCGAVVAGVGGVLGARGAGELACERLVESRCLPQFVVMWVGRELRRDRHLRRYLGPD